jgi:hypothetical protein
MGANGGRMNKKIWGAGLLMVVWGQVAAQQGWPPNTFMTTGNTVRLELRQVWNATVSGKDSDGDWTGSVRGADGRTGVLYAFALQGGGFRFQVAYASSEFCDIPNARGQVALGVYQGSRFFKANKDAQIQADGSCRVTVTSQNAQVNPAPMPMPQPQPQPAPFPASTLSWPPTFEQGQRWRLEVQTLGNLEVTLNAKNNFGEPSGRVGNREVSFNYSRSKEIVEVFILEGQATTVCKFKRDSLNGSSFASGEIQSRPNPQAPLQTQSGSCRATLLGGSSPDIVTPAPQPGPSPMPMPQPQPQPGPMPAPQPQPQAVPPNTSVWPVRLEPGQRWNATIQGIGAWTINFTARDRDGDPTGAATGTSNLQGVFYYVQSDNDVRLELFGGNLSYVCIFERNEINGLVFNGWRYEPTAENRLRKTQQTCTMQYQGGVTLRSLLEPSRWVI